MRRTDPSNALQETAEGIRSMRIRGAAEIGRSAAQALAHHAAKARGDLAAVRRATEKGAQELLSTRPTAVPLQHAVRAVVRAVERAADADGARQGALRAADAFAEATRESRKDIARHGAGLVRDGHRILTHCHSSTVVAVLAAAWADGKRFQVWATETRPFRQGRVTVARLADAGIPSTLIVDGAVHHVLRTKGIDQVLVGADTVSAEGHLLNKVGTAGVAAIAGGMDVPFHAAAGFDKFTDTPAAQIPIEERDQGEVA